MIPILLTLIILLVFSLVWTRQSLNEERHKSERSRKLAYTAVTELQGVIHGLGWFCAKSPDFSKHEKIIKASDLIASAAFYAVVSPKSSETLQMKLLDPLDTGFDDRYKQNLALLDLGRFNDRRDHLLRNPDIELALTLVGSMMNEVMDSVNKELRTKGDSLSELTPVLT